MSAGNETSAGNTRTHRERLDQLRAMQAEAARPDGLHRVVRCLARGIDGRAALVSRTGRALYAFPEADGPPLRPLASEIRAFGSGTTRSVTVHHDEEVLSATPVDEAPQAPVLVVSGDPAQLPDMSALVTDAVRLLRLCWRAESAQQHRDRVQRADEATREAVLHLLMLNERDNAARVAEALEPRLPDPLRVYVVESTSDSRRAVGEQLDQRCRGRAWIVPCPVYASELIVLAPVPAETDARADPVQRRLRAFTTDAPIRVGASQVVALHDVPDGYEQAFHALTSAKRGHDDYVRFDPDDRLERLLGPAGRSWAQRTLQPLLEHVPNRSQDPDAAELRTTLESWLTFHHRAHKQLKIHRNTLSGRLTHLHRILRRNPHAVAEQAELHLALRVLAQRTGCDGADDDINTAFGAAPVQRWARHRLEPLLDARSEGPLSTLRHWLHNDTRLVPTASALGLSPSGTRKRLQSIETLLGRSLLDGPSDRYELYFALRAHDGRALDPVS